MADFGENYHGEDGVSMCPLCSNHPDDQTSSINCIVVKNTLKEVWDIERAYQDEVETKTAHIISKILEIREKSMT